MSVCIYLLELQMLIYCVFFHIFLIVVRGSSTRLDSSVIVCLLFVVYSDNNMLLMVLVVVVAIIAININAYIRISWSIVFCIRFFCVRLLFCFVSFLIFFSIFHFDVMLMLLLQSLYTFDV